MDNQDCCGSSQLADVFCDRLKLLLERGLLIVCLERFSNNTDGTVIADDDCKHLARAFRDIGAGQHDGGG